MGHCGFCSLNPHLRALLYLKPSTPKLQTEPGGLGWSGMGGALLKASNPRWSRNVRKPAAGLRLAVQRGAALLTGICNCLSALGTRRVEQERKG